MSDHADIVREFLDGNNVEGVRSARAALDALVAERDEARVIAKRMSRTPAGEFDALLSRAEAAEAELDRIADTALDAC